MAADLRRRDFLEEEVYPIVKTKNHENEVTGIRDTLFVNHLQAGGVSWNYLTEASRSFLGFCSEGNRIAGAQVNAEGARYPSREKP